MNSETPSQTSNMGIFNKLSSAISGAGNTVAGAGKKVTNTIGLTTPAMGGRRRRRGSKRHSKKHTKRRTNRNKRRTNRK